MVGTILPGWVHYYGILSMYCGSHSGCTFSMCGTLHTDRWGKSWFARYSNQVFVNIPDGEAGARVWDGGRENGTGILVGKERVCITDIDLI